MAWFWLSLTFDVVVVNLAFVVAVADVDLIDGVVVQPNRLIPIRVQVELKAVIAIVVVDVMVAVIIARFIGILKTLGLVIFSSNRLTTKKRTPHKDKSKQQGSSQVLKSNF